MASPQGGTAVIHASSLAGGIPWRYQAGGRGLNFPLIYLGLRIHLGLPLGRAI